MAGEMFGMAVNGKVIHIIEGDPDKGFHAKCEKKMEATPYTEATIADVSCKRCQTYAVYKEYTIAQANGEAPPPKPEKKAKKKPPKTEPEPELAENPEVPELGQVILDRFDGITDALKIVSSRVVNMEDTVTAIDKRVNRIEYSMTSEGNLKAAPEKLSEENYKEWMKEGVKPEEDVTIEGKQFKPKQTGKHTHSIVHIASGQIMFTNVPTRVLDTVMKYLNNVKIQWKNKKEKVPKKFVPACAAAFKAAYASHGLTIDIKTDPEVKPPRVIKRRDKPAGRIIKRRDKPVKAETSTAAAKGINKYGCRIDSARGAICDMLEKGSYYIDIVQNLADYFQYSQKDATGNLKGVIRKVVKKGYPVMYIQQKNRDMDYYHIVENVE